MNWEEVEQELRERRTREALARDEAAFEQAALEEAALQRYDVEPDPEIEDMFLRSYFQSLADREHEIIPTQQQLERWAYLSEVADEINAHEFEQARKLARVVRLIVWAFLSLVLLYVVSLFLS